MMWINHIGEIAMGFFVLLIVIHFALHFVFKAQRIKKDKLTKESLK
ncbi:MAG: hypothetical protein U9R28_00400 [Pseudomonadota bacterium]|nr:hypothetical protein [Pseudomonadota bacterium]